MKRAEHLANSIVWSAPGERSGDGALAHPTRCANTKAVSRFASQHIPYLLAALVFALVPHLARGDGGIVQLREKRGPFLVTVFVSPEVVSGGPTDVSVLVQSQKNGDVVLDADVNLSLIPPKGIATNESDPLCGFSADGAAFQSVNASPHSLTMRATHEQAANKLLYAALLKLDAAGNWPLKVTVSHGSDKASFNCFLPVGAPSAKVLGLWPYLAFPPIAIAAFALNQMLRKHSLERRVGPQSEPVNRTLESTQSQRRLLSRAALRIPTERPLTRKIWKEMGIR